MRCSFSTIGIFGNDHRIIFLEHDMQWVWKITHKMINAVVTLAVEMELIFALILVSNLFFLRRYWKCDIAGSGEGPLKGKRVAVKDTVCVAGVPMMSGLPMLEHFVPDIDATVITRILDAGTFLLSFVHSFPPYLWTS